ncbi:1910_t:CDS:2 [Entrophospora sp. SA101]|nr:1910_t:CDS:2 [Entrophospora sp. SA101]
MNNINVEESKHHFQDNIFHTGWKEHISNQNQSNSNNNNNDLYLEDSISEFQKEDDDDGREIIEFLNSNNYTSEIYDNTVEEEEREIANIDANASSHSYNYKDVEGFLESEDILEYLKQTRYTDDVYGIPKFIKKLIKEARDEMLNDNDQNNPHQKTALERLKMIRDHLLMNRDGLEKVGDKKDNDKEVGVDVNLYEEKNEKTVDNNNNNNNVVEIECNKSSESEAKTKSGRSVRPPGTWWKIKHTVKEKVTKLSRPRKQKSADSNSDLSGYDQTNKSKRNVYSFSNAKRQKLSNVFGEKVSMKPFVV